MKRVYSQVLSIGVLLSVAVVGYTNCAPSGQNWVSLSTHSSETNQSDSASSLPDGLSGKITVGGSGTNKYIASGCTLSSYSDFLEQDSPLARRVEPQNCSVLRINTPIITWYKPRDYKADTSYELKVWAESPSTNKYSTAYYTKTPRFLVPRTLPPGIYAWLVTYANTSGGRTGSMPRRFIIPESGNLFSIPNGDEFARAIQSKAHPRIQPTEPGQPTVRIPFPEVMKRAKDRGYQPMVDNYLRYASTTALVVDTKLKSPPLKRNEVLDIRLNLEAMAYAFHATGNLNYVNKSIEWLKAISKWQTKPVAYDLDSEDQVNRELLLLLGFGMDMFSTYLEKPEYDSVRNLMTTAFKNRLAEINFSSLDRYPYDSHLLTQVQYALESIMYAAGTRGLYGTAAEEAAIISNIWQNAVTTTGTWGGYQDGAFANSVAYGWFAADTAARMMVNAKAMANIDLTRWHVLSDFGNNEIYMTAPLMNIRLPFGDDSNKSDYYGVYSKDTSRLLAMMTKKPEYEWYWRQRPIDAQYPHLYNPLHFIAAATLTQAPQAPPSTVTMPASMLFEGAGMAAIHTKTLDPNRSSIFMRSSRFGSFNHSHADQNSITFISKGKDILISAGYYYRFGTKLHKTVTRATRFKNALTYDGGMGQAEPIDGIAGPGQPLQTMDAPGRIVNFADDGTWAVVTGDATKAYQEFDSNLLPKNAPLSAAYRTVAYNRVAKVAVIYDRAVSSIARKWELNFHTLKLQNSPTTSGATMKIINGTSSACIEIYGLSGSFSYPTPWDGLVEEDGKVADQVHARFSSSVKKPDLATITVIKEDCPQTNPIRSVTWQGAKANVNVNGTVLTFENLSVAVP